MSPAALRELTEVADPAERNSFATAPERASSKSTMNFLFISTMSKAPWGGSEELWSQAAIILKEQGHQVSAFMEPWPGEVPQRGRLQDLGIRICFLRWDLAARGRWLFARLCAWLLRRPQPEAAIEVWGRWICRANPDLVCISDGSSIAGVGWARTCKALGLPFVNLAQANATHWWPDDLAAAEVRATYEQARRMFFVSRGNIALLESQTAWAIPHAEVVRNPHNVDYHKVLPWPAPDSPIKLACVGRLEPASKGQDLLLDVLATEEWKSREVSVTFFGRGASQETLKRLAEMRGLASKVRFAGHVGSIEEIWREHHVLVLPSRYEGLPLALVEAMLCGRFAIVTDVAGNAEVVHDGIDGFVARTASACDLQEALGRAWARRPQWPEIGAAAAVNIRKLVPPDPARIFAARLLEIASETN